MSKIRYTGITYKQGFRYTCYDATTTQNLKDFRNSSLWTCSHIMDIHVLKSQNKNDDFDDFWPDIVALM